MSKEPKSRLVKIGTREIETRGLRTGFATDLYHRSMTVTWPAFFGGAALIFVALNSVFALLYFLGDRPVANVAPDSFLDLLYFSIETLATVGYGDMHPQSHYGHFVATMEIFTGMSFLAVMTGLVFARFSRPKARFIFAQHPVVTLHDGKLTLMIRIANERHNAISGAKARLWLFREEQTSEGQHFRRYYDLALLRPEHPFFALSWTILHVIDESSPLFGLSPEDFTRTNTALALTVSGLDDSSAQQLHARRLYSRQDVRWRHRYVDITNNATDGRLILDYGKFHDVRPDDE